MQTSVYYVITISNLYGSHWSDYTSFVHHNTPKWIWGLMKMVFLLLVVTYNEINFGGMPAFIQNRLTNLWKPGMSFIGKPWTGKPHAWFDEWNRRKNPQKLSLLYRSIYIFHFTTPDSWSQLVRFVNFGLIRRNCDDYSLLNKKFVLNRAIRLIRVLFFPKPHITD